MPYKIMMSLATAVPLIFAVAFLAVPHIFILDSYPNAEGLAMEVGITQRYVMAGMLFALFGLHHILHQSVCFTRIWGFYLEGV